MSRFDQGVIKRDALLILVKNYKDAINDVKTAFALLERASKTLQTTFGENYASFSLVPQMRYESTYEAMHKYIKKEAWRTLIDRFEFKKFMSSKKINKLDESLASNTIPDIEVSTVLEIIEGMSNDIQDNLVDMVREVMDILTPGKNQWDKYATNKKNSISKLGNKVILEWCIEFFYDRFQVTETGYKRLMCIEKVFHTLDGKGVPKGYRSPLIDAINATRFESPAGETDYFIYKCHKNNNLHLEFKRIDLVDQINLLASEGNTLGGVTK